MRNLFYFTFAPIWKQIARSVEEKYYCPSRQDSIEYTVWKQIEDRIDQTISTPIRNNIARHIMNKL